MVMELLSVQIKKEVEFVCDGCFSLWGIILVKGTRQNIKDYDIGLYSALGKKWKLRVRSALYMSSYYHTSSILTIIFSVKRG